MKSTKLFLLVLLLCFLAFLTTCVAEEQPATIRSTAQTSTAPTNATLTNTPYPIPFTATPTAEKTRTPSPTLTFTQTFVPTSTPIPLATIAADAEGEILFLDITDHQDTRLMKVDVDKNGQAKNKEPVLITDALPNYGQMYDGMGDMFPSPDGNKIFAPFMTEGPSFFVYDIPSGETNGIHLGDFVFFLGWNSNSRNIIWGDDYRGVWQTDVKGEHKSPLLAKIHGKYERIISAAVSPNGKQIVYTHTVFNAYATELWMIDDDGKNDRKIMDAHTAVSDLAWSPDGQKIAFWYYSGYWVMNADGSNPHQIVEMPSRRGRLPILWSPDSKMLLVDWGNFVDNMMLDFTYSNIFVLDVESGESRTLLPDGSKGHLFPAWSPDGQKIAFISTRAGKPDVWVINRDGTGLHQVTHDRREIRFLFWRKP